MLTILGLPPAAATLTILTVTFLAIFQHANLRTPRWLGYIVQRPESHTIHHARGVHAKNYADLPVIDMLFGTFENPRSYEHTTGFWHGASARVLDMLLWRDVSNASPRA
jgi:sterol desaturase/sphingolipid hydroxylase (fatty acid hydroxylase superfamily)